MDGTALAAAASQRVCRELVCVAAAVLLAIALLRPLPRCLFMHDGG